MSKAALLEQWRDHLAQSRRRSPHTVRAYCAAAGRLIEQTGAEDWDAVARLDSAALRNQLAARRADGIGNVSAARELSALKGFMAFAREQVGQPEAGAPACAVRGSRRACRARLRPTTPPTWPTKSLRLPPTTGSARATGRCCC